MDKRRIERNKKICELFTYMYNKKHLRVEYILKKLSERYGLHENTISHIIKGYGPYKEGK